MGRELRRKEERKNKNKVVNKEKKLNNSIKKSTVIKVASVIALILLVLWYILAIFVTKEIDISSGNNESSEATENSGGVSNRILASATFEQAEEVYYVYYYDFNDEDQAVASTISSKSDLKIYRVDTSSSLNQKYVTEDSGNTNVKEINDLKVKNPTLLQITNDEVTGYYEGSSNILDFLNK